MVLRTSCVVGRYSVLRNSSTAIFVVKAYLPGDALLMRICNDKKTLCSQQLPIVMPSLSGASVCLSITFRHCRCSDCLNCMFPCYCGTVVPQICTAIYHCRLGYCLEINYCKCWRKLRFNVREVK